MSIFDAEELAIIRMSQMQRDLFTGWLIALEVQGQHQEAAALKAITKAEAAEYEQKDLAA